MTARRLTRTTALLVGGATFLTTATLAGCSGDGDSAPAGAGDFCTQMAAFAAASDDAGADELTPEVLTEMRALAESAPDGEVRDALEAALPLIEQIEELDENDPQQFEQIMQLVFAPELSTAAQVLEQAWSDDCDGGN